MLGKNFKMLLAAIILAAGFLACEKEGGENETKISSFNSTSSHNMGKDCMSCHKSGGPGEGWFVVAGTVYDESKTTTLPNATIGLYTNPEKGGTLVASLEGDGKGNFYTTEKIDFGTGLYVSVIGNTTTKSMNTPITTGKCNSCHGVSMERIWTK